MARIPLRRLGACAAALIVAATTVLGGPGTPAQAAEKCKPESRTGQMSAVPWPLKRLQPERIWPLTRGAGVKVAVIDSGVGEHPLLDGQVTAVDMVGDKLGARCDMASHGTIVAGLIAAKDTESSPFHGLAPDAKILSYRVIQSMEKSTAQESTVPVVNAIRLAVEDGAKVINLSLTAIATPALESAIKYAHDEGVVVVAAAGNSGAASGQQKEYPAAYESVIAVAGLSQSGTHVDSSSVRNYVDVAAPGEEIDGPAPAGGGFGRLVDGGTSFAAPYVSATAALLMSLYPNMKPDEVARRITATAVHPPGGWNPVVGYGELDPYRAVTTLLSEVDERTPPAAAVPVLPGDPGKAMREKALLVTGAAGLAVVALLIVRFVVPLGRRRGWRAG
ncbi:type VII secretion-associated serine protease mycosin [Phytomonospora endophytica]|uniref:Type VII secretion-associated serine protease mycosin n=1 Tax=Phytomonospora endophytica TaxID=714109 RepID=A0A841FVM9_9ACTN|nr:type VII secretion-associated serine protease mycosin [Phytomonospora endophytica]MBB6037788.1 type VII secretion-associated serine protease mycosin [Phytomonospora endophytica]GIG67683.1 hypothetical protein Pen01_39780 [Phytomonospora endophytica]